jgi:hypothetical protein
MGPMYGMRGTDLLTIVQAAKLFNCIILVRHTNSASLEYVGKPLYYPKPAVCKAKTADGDPGPRAITYKGKTVTKQYRVAGLVVHPGFHAGCYAPAKRAKAMDCWHHTMEVLSPASVAYDVNPQSWDLLWGRPQHGIKAPDWDWRVDVNPESDHFGCLMLKSHSRGWERAEFRYIHGDYDLKDVIVSGHEDDYRFTQSKMDGVKNITPVLHQASGRNIPGAYRGGQEYLYIMNWLNMNMGAAMVQHGSEAQFTWHTDEPITVAYPNGKWEVLRDGAQVHHWYAMRGRNITKVGFKYFGPVARL